MGRVVRTPRDIASAFKELDMEGERLFCKDKSGLILEITGGQSSPLYPQVLFTIWIDLGKSTEKAEEKKESIVEFGAREPKVVDIEKEMDQG